jgi:DNA-binding phage protein
VRTGRRHAVSAFVSIECRPGRRRSETGFEDFLVRHGGVGKLGGGLCEVRTTFDKNEYRVFFYIEREQVVVVHSTSNEGGHMTIGPPRDELEELFDELGELHDLRAGVQKKVLAHDIKQAMKAKGISPSEMARRMRTSREAVYRLLDPTRTGVTLDSLQRAASALGLTLNISFEPPARRSAARPHGLAGRRKKRAA